MMVMTLTVVVAVVVVVVAMVVVVVVAVVVAVVPKPAQSAITTVLGRGPARSYEKYGRWWSAGLS